METKLGVCSADLGLDLMLWLAEGAMIGASLPFIMDPERLRGLIYHRLTDIYLNTSYACSLIRLNRIHLHAEACGAHFGDISLRCLIFYFSCSLLALLVSL